MKNILFLMKSMQGGGAEKVLLNILKNMDYQKYNISLVLVFNEGIYLNDIPKNVKVSYIFEKETYENNQMIINQSKSVYLNNIKEDYDIEIAFLEGICTKIIGNSTQNSKKIAWVHVDLLNCHYTSSMYNSIQEEEDTYHQFDEIVFVSKYVKESFYKLFPSLNTKGRVLYNPIDIDQIKKLSKAFNVDYDKTTFITIGRLTNQKGFDRLINAVSKLSNENFNFQIIILGKGPKYNELKEQIHNLKLENYIFLKGFEANPYPYLLASNAFISSSRSEGLALVLCEALILNKQIIATNCSGVNEALDYGKYGHIIENSELGIYIGIKDFLINGSNYTISEKAFSKFSLKKSIEKICDLIDNISLPKSGI